ncbi:alpha/beta fold hydrolase [Microbacterium sp. 1P10AE]|uniref:alpha/beta fold hydrolase n=1 Tax=Microbacterium sp. 1P10AE TaxID=3132286 RepID=UPI0039A0C7E9
MTRSTPRHPDPSWLDRTSYPLSDAYVDVAGHEVHYVDTGAPPLAAGAPGESPVPTVLFLHGNPTWSFVYREIIARLALVARCIAPDLPGFGLSQAAAGYRGTFVEHADAVERFVSTMGLNDLVIVVQDWGGPIGLRLVERRPDLFRGVVICNSWAWPVDADPHFARFAGFMGGRVGSALIRRFNLFVNALVPLGHRRRRLGRREMAQYRKPLATGARREFSAVLPREIVDTTPQLAQVAEGLGILDSLPVLIVWGDRDIAFREAELARWRAEVPGAEVHVVSGAGHFVQSDSPDEVAGVLRAWLEAEGLLAAENATAEESDTGRL